MRLTGLSNTRLAAAATRGEQFSLWAMRLWWGGFPELDRAWPDLVAGFRAYGVQGAIEACHRFCSTALAAAGCGYGIGCLQCPHITPTEERLLAALAAASSGDLDSVESRLQEVLPASAARLAAPHAVRLVRALATSGFEWPAGAAREIADWPAVSNYLH